MTDPSSAANSKPQPSAQLNVQQLHTFRHVYCESGYAAAARACQLSVPTVWQHIQALEKAYGVRLFQKVGRQVRPTEAARRLYTAVDEILEGLDSTFDTIKSSTTEDDAITLVTGVRMMLEDLSQPLGAFRQRFANRLSIRHGDNRRAEELLVAGEDDLALTLEPSVGQQSTMIHYEPAYFVEFLAVARPEHPFWQAGTSSLREVVAHDLIVTAPGTHGREALEQAIHRERLQANIAVETDNSGFTIACAQAGMGLGILAGRSDGQLCHKLKTRSLRRQLGRRQIVFMWRNGRRLTEPLAALVDEIRSANG